MYIIAHWNGHGIRVGCMICGEGFDLGEVAYDALTEDAPHAMIGAVCEACMVLSEAELRQRSGMPPMPYDTRRSAWTRAPQSPCIYRIHRTFGQHADTSSACMTRPVWAGPVVSPSPRPCVSASLSASVTAINGWRGSTD
jgi:hypothetical protein